MTPEQINAAIVQLVPHLDKLLMLRKKISNYGYRTGRPNDGVVADWEDEFIRAAVELCDIWRTNNPTL